MLSYFLPLGALTAKAYAFVSRSWELNKFTTFDFTSGELPLIHFFYRGVEIIRVLPFGSLEEGEWISNRTRFFFEGFKLQRLVSPFLRLFNSRIHCKVNWFTSFSFFLAYLDECFLPNSFFKKFGYRNSLIGSSVGIDFANGFTGFDQLSFLKTSFARFGFGQFYSSFGLPLNSSSFLCEWRSFYMGKESSVFDSCTFSERNPGDYFFFFFNPRLESPLLNSRFRTLSNGGDANILTFGSSAGFLNYRTYDLGISFLRLSLFLQGRHRFCRYFSQPLPNSLTMVYGLGLVTSFPSICLSSKIFVLFQRLTEIFQFCLKNENFQILPLFQQSSAITELEIGYPPMGWLRSKGSSILYVQESNEIDVNVDSFNLVVYQGFQAEYSIHFSDLVFPTLAYFEDSFAAWRNNSHFISSTPLIRDANTNARSNFSIVEKLDLFVSQKRASSLQRGRPGFSSSPAMRMVKNRYIIRLLNRFLYKFFLASSLLFSPIVGIFSKLSIFMKYLENLRPGILTDMSSAVTLRLWAYEMRCWACSPFGLLPGIPINSIFTLSQVKTSFNWYKFFLISESFLFKNIAFLTNIQRRAQVSYRPKFFFFFAGGLHISLARTYFGFLAMTSLLGRITNKFRVLPFYCRQRRLRYLCSQRKLVKRIFLGRFLVIFKKLLMRRLLNLCTLASLRFLHGGFQALQAQLFPFEAVGASNFGYFGSCVRVLIFLSRGDFVKFKSFLALFPVFSSFLDFHYSSTIRLSKTLFLESRYFYCSLYNFYGY